MYEKEQISIVVPILDERDSLRELHSQLSEVLTGLNREYEIIFVDDGSTDGSTELIRELTEIDQRTILIEMRRHFGKATALQAGFQIAKGDVIITMDGDLQDDPFEIPRFLEALDTGLDLVTGWKKERRDPITKTVPSSLWNFITARLTGLPLMSEASLT